MADDLKPLKIKYLAIFLISRSLYRLLGHYILLDHIEVECTAIEGLLLNSGKEHTRSREVEIKHLFWWHESNFLDLETKLFMSRHLVDINTLSMSLIGIVFLTWLKFLLSIGMNGEFCVVWLPVNTEEFVNNSVNLNLLM